MFRLAVILFVAVIASNAQDYIPRYKFDLELRKCNSQMAKCTQYLGQLRRTRSETEAIEYFKTTPVSAICHSFESVHGCVTAVFERYNCNSWHSDHQRKMLAAAGEALQFLCHDEILLVEENKQCFANIELVHQAGFCERQNIHEPYSTTPVCNVEEFLTCLDGALDQNEDCGETAKPLLNRFVRQFIYKVHECGGQEESTQIEELLKFF
jgi:hypothetical protein